jgi:hypothetical protein
MAVPMDKLDDLVASHLESQLLQPGRLETILAAVLDRREEHAERRRDRLIGCQIVREHFEPLQAANDNQQPGRPASMDEDQSGDDDDQ